MNKLQYYIKRQSPISDTDWKRFSEIQCASFLIQDKEAIERFWTWMKSGDDDDAWS